MMFSWWRLVTDMDGGGQWVEDWRNRVAVCVDELVLIQGPMERVLRRQFQMIGGPAVDNVANDDGILETAGLAIKGVKPYICTILHGCLSSLAACGDAAIE